MKKVAIKVFITASVLFGVFGIVLVLLGGPEDDIYHEIIFRLLAADGFLVLSSFGVAVGLHLFEYDRK